MRLTKSAYPIPKNLAAPTAGFLLFQDWEIMIAASRLRLRRSYLSFRSNSDNFSASDRKAPSGCGRWIPTLDKYSLAGCLIGPSEWPGCDVSLAPRVSGNGGVVGGAGRGCAADRAGAAGTMTSVLAADSAAWHAAGPRYSAAAMPR